MHARITQAKRRLAEKAAISQHFKDEIKAIYFACPEGMEVDHIHPLGGKTASGLHVPWNLQYLPVSKNRSKGNRIT